MPAGHEQHGWIRDPQTPYEVSRVKIAEFAEAIGDPNPGVPRPCRRAQAGYPDVIAPPTFAVVVALPASIAAAQDAFPGPGSPIVVHVEQRFDYARPICAGDVLHAESAVTSIREIRSSVMVTTRTEIRTADGEQICIAHMTLATLPPEGNGEPPRHA